MEQLLLGVSETETFRTTDLVSMESSIAFASSLALNRLQLLLDSTKGRMCILRSDWRKCLWWLGGKYQEAFKRQICNTGPWHTLLPLRTIAPLQQLYELNTGHTGSCLILATALGMRILPSGSPVQATWQLPLLVSRGAGISPYLLPLHTPITMAKPRSPL